VFHVIVIREYMRADELQGLVDSAPTAGLADVATAGDTIIVAVLVVACSSLLQTLVRTTLQSEAFRFIAAPGAEPSALRAYVSKAKPGLAIVDASCPRWRESVAALAVAPFAPRVLVVGEAGSERELIAAVEGGAAGYLDPAEATIDRLARALRSLMEGHAVLSVGSMGMLSQLGQARTTAVPAADAPLTERQRRVVTLAVQGHTNREIAAALCIELTTVKKHLNAAFAALGVTSRSELRDAVAAGPAGV
jgi:DNA-binding NarL/FixJ family response regulator